RPLVLRGRALEDCTEAQAQELRAAGYNLVVVPGGRAAVWGVADRVGLFVLGRLSGDVPPVQSQGTSGVARPEQEAKGVGGACTAFGKPGGRPPRQLAAYPGTRGAGRPCFLPRLAPRPGRGRAARAAPGRVRRRRVGG